MHASARVHRSTWAFALMLVSREGQGLAWQALYDNRKDELPHALHG